MSTTPNKLIDHALLTASGCLAIGLLLLCLGYVTIPLTGYGSVYLAAFGFWTMLLGAVPAVVWVIAVCVHRLRHGEWRFGFTDSE